MERELGLELLAPFLVQKRVMVFSIVANHNDSSRGARADLTQQFEKLPKCLGVENLLLSLGKQLAVAQAHRSEIAHAFACRSMKQNWIFYFGWYPHPTARTMLLEMNLIQGPKINADLLSQRPEFFYAGSVIQDRRVQSWAWACGAEILAGGRVAGTVEY